MERSRGLEPENQIQAIVSDRNSLPVTGVQQSTSLERTLLLLLEFSLIFVAFPLAIYFHLVPNNPILFLVLIALAAFLVLRRDDSFDRSMLTYDGETPPLLKHVLLRDAVLLAVLGLGVWLFAPELLFSLIKRAPGLWVAIMVLYPVLSVYPQEFLFRTFFFHRYRPVFGDGSGIVVASGLVFSFVHIIFHNWLAVALTLVGGLLFSWTYRRSSSLLLTCIDHALFGNFLFTIGLGQYFLHTAPH